MAFVTAAEQDTVLGMCDRGIQPHPKEVKKKKRKGIGPNISFRVMLTNDLRPLSRPHPRKTAQPLISVKLGTTSLIYMLICEFLGDTVYLIGDSKLGRDVKMCITCYMHELEDVYPPCPLPL